MICEILLLFFGICLLLWFSWTVFMKRNHSYWQARNIRFFNNTKLFSTWDRITLKHGFHEIEQIVYNAAKKEGITTYAGLIEFGAPTLYVVDPELIKTILVKDFDSFVDRRVLGVEKTDPLFAKMLINIKGQAWKDLRATMSPTFTTGKIRRMYSVFNDSSDKLAEFLRRETQNVTEIELRDAISRYTMDVIASAAFGLDSQSFASYQSDFAKFAKQFQNQFSGIRAFKFLLVFFSPKLMSFLRISLTDHDATDFFSRVIQDTIKHREATGEKRQDFLQLMMEAQNAAATESSSVDELSTFEKEAQLQSSHSKVPLTEELIIAQSLLFFLGGFDTVETMLLMAAYELSLNSDVQEKLYNELKDASDSNRGELNYDHVMKLDYLDQVASETLRKWPPGVRLERKSTKAYQIPNTESIIDNDTLVSVPVYGIHRDEQYYPNPEKFDPERFTAENKSKRNPYTYMPFGAGPRNCIAMRFALAEGKAAIAHLILNFKLEPSAKTEIPLKFKPMTAFKPANGLWLRVTPRN